MDIMCRTVHVRYRGWRDERLHGCNFLHRSIPAVKKTRKSQADMTATMAVTIQNYCRIPLNLTFDLSASENDACATCNYDLPF